MVCKKLKHIRYYAFLLLMVAIFSVCITGCGGEESKYEFGTMENIDDKFEIISGTVGTNSVWGTFDSVTVRYAQTKDGGLVAWKDNNYAYVKDTSDISPKSLCATFATHFEYIKPISFD